MQKFSTAFGAWFGKSLKCCGGWAGVHMRKVLRVRKRRKSEKRRTMSPLVVWMMAAEPSACPTCVGCASATDCSSLVGFSLKTSRSPPPFVSLRSLACQQERQKGKQGKKDGLGLGAGEQVEALLLESGREEGRIPCFALGQKGIG